MRALWLASEDCGWDGGGEEGVEDGRAQIASCAGESYLRHGGYEGCGDEWK